MMLAAVMLIGHVNGVPAGRRQAGPRMPARHPLVAKQRMGLKVYTTCKLEPVLIRFL